MSLWFPTEPTPYERWHRGDPLEMRRAEDVPPPSEHQGSVVTGVLTVAVCVVCLIIGLQLWRLW